VTVLWRSTVRERQTVDAKPSVSEKPCARVNFPNEMAYIITETCVDLKDKSCVDVCPVDCIIDGGAEDRLLVINPDECIDCGACVDPCPVAAIFPEDEVPPEQKKFIPWNFDYFKSDADKARVRAEINAAYPEKRKTEGAP
jgi:ferredoxin